jgi:peptidoglycan hydrolase CwlO-like protein
MTRHIRAVIATTLALMMLVQNPASLHFLCQEAFAWGGCDCTDEQNKVNNLRQQLDALNAQLLLLNAQAAGLVAAILALQVAILALTKKINKWVAELNSYPLKPSKPWELIKVAALRAQIDAALKILKQMQKQLKQLKDQLKAIQDQIKELREKIKQIQDALAIAEAELAKCLEQCLAVVPNNTPFRENAHETLPIRFRSPCRADNPFLWTGIANAFRQGSCYQGAG